MYAQFRQIYKRNKKIFAALNTNIGDAHARRIRNMKQPTPSNHTMGRFESYQRLPAKGRDQEDLFGELSSYGRGENRPVEVGADFRVRSTMPVMRIGPF